MPTIEPWPPVRTSIKADLRCASVAAASVLAKTTRDAMMIELASAHPEYGWDENKGYASAKHRAALLAHGPTPYHYVEVTGLQPGTTYCIATASSMAT